MYPECVSDDSVLEQEFGERFNKIALLKARTSIKELSGGLTNRNFLIETPADKYVARVSSNSSDFLSIDRGSEFINTTIAGKGGVGAEVLDYIPGEGQHGSAPDIAGQGIANPIGQIWSGAMMLEFLGHKFIARSFYKKVSIG